MNCLSRILLLILLPLCSSAITVTKTIKTSISGVIKNKKDTTIKITISDERKVDYADEKEVRVINGHFKIQFEIYSAHYIRIDYPNDELLPFQMYGVFSFLIEPGDHIVIDNTKGDQFNRANVVYGKGSEKLQCLRKVYANAVQLNAFSDFFEDESLTRISCDDQLINTGLATITSYKTKLSPTAYDLLRADWQALIYTYEVKALYGKKTSYELLSNRFIAVKPIVDAQKESILYSFQYMEFLKCKALFGFKKENNLSRKDRLSAQQIYELLKVYPSPLREKLQALEIQHLITGNDFTPALVQLTKTFFKECDSNNINVKEIDRIYSNTVRIIPGSEAYPFELKDTAGKVVRLSDFTGKAVLIDFMFTNCPGCVEMVPALTKLEHAFREKDIVFVSISVEKTLAQVKEGIGQSAVANSLQLYTNGEGSSHQIIKHYQVGAFPRLLLIDKAGKVVAAQAPDPRRDDGVALTTMIQKTIQ